MPTVLRLKGYRFMIYTNEPANERPHVHIIKDDRDAKIWVDEPEFVKGADLFKAKEVREIMEMVKEYQSFFLEKWEEIHGDKE
ncbi:MAG: DUF4160 domain-containing protein [Anaerolineae bacterium]|nr:DUF4160 domain-containing protein [Anaerolineae bacterium]